MLHLRERQHPIFSSNEFVGPKIFERRNDCRFTTTVICAAELLFRTFISANQLIIHGAISDWCEEVAQRVSDRSFSNTRKPVANMNEQSLSIVTRSRADLHESASDQRSGTGKLVAKS